MAEPITRLTKKKEEFSWKEEQDQAFIMLKEKITSAPVLALYDPKWYTELHTDASASGLSGMLFQQGDDKLMRLVYCISKKTSEAESRYHSTKLELMAIVWCLDRLRVMLLGIKVTVITDCQALVYLNANKTKSSQVARWFDLLQEYDVEVKHRPGERMAHVDALSRAAVEPADDVMETIIESRLEVMLALSEEDHVMAMQYGDKDLKDLIEDLKTKPEERSAEQNRRVQEFSLRNGMLYQKDKTDGIYRWVVPKAMRKSLVVKFHDLAGHFSIDRTIQKIKERYFFPKMRCYVRFHIRNCP